MTQFANAQEEFAELFAIWRNEGVTPLTAVIQGAKALLDSQAGELNKDQRQLLEMIYRKGLRAAECWHSPSDYIHLRYGKVREEWASVRLKEVISHALSHLKEYTHTENIKVDLPDNLPPVRANSYLSRVFVYLFDSPPLRYYIVDYPAILKATLNNLTNITVQIYIEQRFESEFKDQAHFFYPGSRASIAQLIVRQHGSELQMRSIDEGIEIQFELPIWSEHH